MKIVNITGGLGNQMFQYAFAIYLKNKFPNEKVYIDTQHYNTLFFKKFKGINLHNGFEINKIYPKATLPVASFRQLSKISYWIPNYLLSRIFRKVFPVRNTEYIADYTLNYSFDRTAAEHNGDCYYEGYWQCIKYLTEVRDEICQVFSHPAPDKCNSDLIEQIRNSISVGIHVRRGDYLNEPEFKGICGINYYTEAIEAILQHSPNCEFFIFSNDITWCKDNLVNLFKGAKYTFVTVNKGAHSCWDMFLMTYCRNLIIANSSFSWWGAFLNKNADRVYAPYPWLNRNCEIDLYDDSWIKINCNPDSLK